MRFYTFALFILLSSGLLSAQEAISPAQGLEDYTILVDILESSHPALFDYQTQQHWDSAKAATEQKIRSIKSDLELAQCLYALTDQVKDGHLILFEPPGLNLTNNYFPLTVKIIEERLYIDFPSDGVAPGDEILSIDGIETADLLTLLYNYEPSDGYNVTKKQRLTEIKFGLFHALQFGSQTEYLITVKNKTGEISQIVAKAKPFEEVKKQHLRRASHGSATYNKETRNLFIDYLATKSPQLHFIDSLNTAILFVNSFGVDIKEYQDRLIDVFKALKKRKTEHLIIDVRRNNGGYRPNAMHLYSFLAEQPFKEREYESVKTLHATQPEHITRTLVDQKRFLTDRFTSKKQDSVWINYDDADQKLMRPHKLRFTGKTYVLTSGQTFSAATTFAIHAKDDHDITVVGQETGGGYHSHCGEFPVYYKLPNSGIPFVMSLVKVKHHCSPLLPIGRGVLPDYQVEQSPRDLIRGTDVELEFCLEMIAAN